MQLEKVWAINKLIKNLNQECRYQRIPYPMIEEQNTDIPYIALDTCNGEATIFLPWNYTDFDYWVVREWIIHEYAHLLFPSCRRHMQCSHCQGFWMYFEYLKNRM